MAALALVGGIFLIAVVSAFVPVFSLELALIVAAAAGTSLGMLAAIVVAAAAGHMIAKSCFFVGGRTAFEWHRGRSKRPSQRSERLRRAVTRATGQRHAAEATVLVSAITGLPPFALVSALAGAGRIRLRSFIVMGFAGRSARFAALMLVPGAANLF